MLSRAAMQFYWSLQHNQKFHRRENLKLRSFRCFVLPFLLLLSDLSLFFFLYLLSLWDKYLLMRTCDFAFKETHTIAFHCNPIRVVSVHLPV
jgi:hypothetical protein